MTMAAVACDCHMHIFNARYPTAPGVTRLVPDFSVADYRKVQAAMGTRRVVVVQPSTYGTDNRGTIEAVAQIGTDARAVAVLDDTVSDAEIRRLDGLGVRGIRFNLVTAGPQPTMPHMIEPLAVRVAPFGWHVQVYLTAQQVVGLADVLRRLPVPVVFDHFGRIPLPLGIGHPAYAIVADLLAGGRAWVKLSGPYHFSFDGPPDYADTFALARSFLSINPDQLVWGSDWPHPSLPNDKPNPASWMRLFEKWVEDASVRRRILADNPARLYGYASA